MVQRAWLLNTGQLDDIYQDPHELGPRLQLHYGDLTDAVAHRCFGNTFKSRKDDDQV